MATDLHPSGSYRYVPGIDPYSGGVRAEPGHRIVHASLRRPLPWQDGLRVVDAHLVSQGAEAAALCSVELRCAKPHSFGGFDAFNDEYRSALNDRGLLLDRSAESTALVPVSAAINPVARTNVAPVVHPPNATELHAFGYVGTDEWSDGSPSFVIAGAGDLRDQSDLAPAAIVRAGERWVEAGAERAAVVLDEMEARMASLDVTWSDATTVDVYCAEPIHPVLESVVLERLGPAARRGVHWYLAAPPIVGLTFEMDLRGGTEEIWL